MNPRNLFRFFRNYSPKDGQEFCSHFSDEAGFTLIEVLVAVVILAVGLVSVVQGMARIEQAFRISRNLVTASQILDNKLTESEMDVRQFHELRTGKDQDKKRLPGREFRWTREIRPYVDESIEDETKLNQVGIVVEWKEGPRRQSRLALQSLIVNREKIQ